MSEFQSLFGQFMAKYRNDLIGFAKDIHNIEFDRNQRPIAEAIQRGDRLITVRSGHGVGKTTILSVATSWYANTRFPVKIIQTAPSAKQLWDALWPETRARFRELPEFLAQNFNLLAERIELKADPDQCFISPATSTKENPEAIAGKHSANVLLIVDEASGIPEEVFVAGSGSMSGHNAQTVLTGNPVRRNGFFFRTHMDADLASMWTRFKISALDSAYVTADFVRQIEVMFGKNSNQYRVRVLGEFPESDDESFIPRAVVIAAMQREIIKPPFRPIWGVDPARFGRDKSSLSERFGPVTMPMITWHGMDTMQSCGLIVNKFRECFPGEEPSQILVDVIGLGAGVVDRLRELGLPVVGVNVSETSAMGSQGVKLRDELWIRGRMELMNGGVVLPYDEELADQLSQPGYEFMSDGRIKIESKEKMKKRGLGSPDKADSWLNTYAGDAAVVIGGAGSWGTPRPRKIAVV